MSEAKKWAARLTAFIAENAPVVEDDDGEQLAHVDEYGDMAIDKRGSWDMKDARRLAQWILDIFGEK